MINSIAMVSFEEIIYFLGTYCELCWLLPIQKLARRVKYIPYPPVLSSAFTDITPFEVKIGRSLIEVDKGDILSCIVKSYA